MLAGVVLVFVRRRFAERHIAFQRAVFRFDFGAREERISRVLAVIVGIGFICFGLIFAFS
jgi:hypothetical protein